MFFSSSVNCNPATIFRVGLKFKVLKQKWKARAGEIELNWVKIPTPVFMPVGTKATVKGIILDLLENPDYLWTKSAVKIILANTYHLYLRPGEKIVEQFGSLHNFIGWKKPILTDSGGFQVFSLAKLRKKSNEGVEFQSHIDGSFHFFNPKIVMEIQEALYSDIMMIFDDCVEYNSSKKAVEIAMKRKKRVCLCQR